MMRSVFRPVLVGMAAALLGTSAGLTASAQDILEPTVHRHGDRVAELINRRLPVPALPPAELRLFDDDGGVGATPPAPRSTGRGALRLGVAPALPFDERAPAAAVQALLTGSPGADAPMRSVPVSDPPAVAAAPADAADRAHEATVGSAPGAAAEGSTPAPSAPPLGIDATNIAAALTSFATQNIAGDTAAQALERHRTRETIAAFYAARADAPLWTADGHFTAGARSALARIDHATEDALDLSRFTVPVPRTGDPSVVAGAELALSEAVVAYGRQAGGARVDVARLGGLIDFRPEVATPERVLADVSAAAEPGEALRGFNPPQPGYLALREKLAELRRSDVPETQNRIPAGPVLRRGMKDARVPLIRARFGLDVASVEPGVPTLVYDTKVAAAVAEFQRAHGLPASGLLNAGTVAALSGGNPSKLENAIMANMELWRWMPRDIADDRVEVNIPDYTARVMRNGAVLQETRVVVGQPDKPTPVFAEQMRFVIVNPYWNVPLSIIKNEMLPKLAADPNYFANHGYEVVEHDGMRYVRQPPGEGNALGRIKFMFPNSHSVYLHDTNARSFFARDMRALSHGCVRVDQPFSFAEAVLGRDNGWTEARVRKLIGGQERTIMLPKPLPILITYFTAFVDPQKGFQLRDDVYGYAGRVKTALNLQD